MHRDPARAQALAAATKPQALALFEAADEAEVFCYPCSLGMAPHHPFPPTAVLVGREVLGFMPPPMGFCNPHLTELLAWLKATYGVTPT